MLGRFRVLRGIAVEMIFCPNCGKLTGYKRALGFGTFFGALLTAGLWLLAIPFYPKRCITCGLGKSESVPWYQTWRLAVVMLAGAVIAAILVHAFSPPRATLRSSGDRSGENARSVTALPQALANRRPDAQLGISRAERRLFGEKTTEVESLGVISETMQDGLAVTTHCQAHFCANHYAVWTVDLSTGQAAGALVDATEAVIYLGDYEGVEKLPSVLQAETEQQRKEDLPSPKPVRYVSQTQ